MRVLNIFLFAFLVLNSNISYSKANSEFNKIEDKINYLNKRIGFLYFEFSKAEQLIFRTNALITKKEHFTAELYDHLNSLNDCGKQIKINSADFRLQKWLYTYSKKLKSQKKHIIKDIVRAEYETTKSNLENEAICLKQHAENLDQDSCGFLICSINKLLSTIDTFHEYYSRLKKEEEDIICRIDELREAALAGRRELSNCCCWV
ncbi:MAG: hypothetical protein P4L22_06060 [Candidatus Babeliales bacterium]|nr:hypothetical protein [Candidatus Babeliales bacterium]